MREYNKKELFSSFGETILFENEHIASLFDKLKYIAGFKPFNKFIYSSSYDGNVHTITFNKRKNGLEIMIDRGPFHSSTGLGFNQLLGINIEHSGDIISNGDHSAAVKALDNCSSNCLLDKLAPILKNASADAAKERLPDYLLTLIYSEYASAENYMLFGFYEKHYHVVEDYFIKLFPGHLKN